MLVDKNGKTLVDHIYPVGSIYMSVNSTNPSVLFGGTWEQWGSGRVPVGFNSDDSAFNKVELTGGTKEYELRALVGAVSGNINTLGYEGAAIVPGRTSYTRVIDAASDAAPQAASNSTPVYRAIDGGLPTTIQPYVVCYMWKRVA